MFNGEAKLEGVPASHHQWRIHTIDPGPGGVGAGENSEMRTPKTFQTLGQGEQKSTEPFQNVFKMFEIERFIFTEKCSTFARVKNVQNSAKSTKCEIIANIDFGDSHHGFTCIYQTCILHFVCVLCGETCCRWSGRLQQRVTVPCAAALLLLCCCRW